MRSIQMVLLALAALALGVLAAMLVRSDERTELVSGLALDKPRPLPAFQLVDHDGQPFTNARLQDRWSLVFAGFTHCPDFCPNTLTLLKAVTARMQRDDAEPQVLFLTVDPERDTVQALKPYVEHFHPEYLGLTGSATEIERVTKALGLAYAKVPQDQGYTMDHSVALVLINPQGRIAAYFSPPHEIATLSQDLERMMERGA